MASMEDVPPLEDPMKGNRVEPSTVALVSPATEMHLARFTCLGELDELPEVDDFATVDAYEMIGVTHGVQMNSRCATAV